MKKTITISLLFFFSILLAACGAGQPTEPAAPTVDISLIQTQAVQTVVAGVTRTAQALPTETPVPPTETLVPSPTVSATPENTATATVNVCNNSIFVADISVADGAQIEAGKKFVKTWKVKNIGSCNWTTTYTLRYGYSDRMAGRDSYLREVILPGQEAEISLELTAPTKPGSYRGYWVLFDNNGYSFGQYLSVIINVP
ncbi:MAG: NBR1-Ig-like domain-containing protein [Anaerolineales bacterium]|jgi:hypothetical protein|nr:NBR1-Ig-like domain-containing protein [Anaerolineales bacterium]